MFSFWSIRGFGGMSSALLLVGIIAYSEESRFQGWSSGGLEMDGYLDTLIGQRHALNDYTCSLLQRPGCDIIV
jgi:hypothetical protein